MGDQGTPETAPGDAHPEHLGGHLGHVGGRLEHLGNLIEERVFALDDAVTPAHDAPNAVFVDETPAVRWAGPAFLLLAAVLVPWSIYLGATLPGRAVSSHYDVAWAGYDVGEVILLAGTGLLALRRSRWLALAATGTATALVTDAWFDVFTSTGSQVWQAVVLAVAVELPLAAVCLWLAHHSQDLNERRMRLVLTRLRESRRPGDGESIPGPVPPEGELLRRPPT